MAFPTVILGPVADAANSTCNHIVNYYSTYVNTIGFTRAEAGLMMLAALVVGLGLGYLIREASR